MDNPCCSCFAWRRVVFQSITHSDIRSEYSKIIPDSLVNSLFGMLVIIIYILCAVFAPMIAPMVKLKFCHPDLNLGSDYWLGTDNLGRDVLPA